MSKNKVKRVEVTHEDIKKAVEILEKYSPELSPIIKKK